MKRLKRRILQLIKPILPITVTIPRHSRSNTLTSNCNGTMIATANNNELATYRRNNIAAPVGGRLFRSTSTMVQRSSKVIDNGK